MRGSLVLRALRALAAACGRVWAASLLGRLWTEAPRGVAAWHASVTYRGATRLLSPLERLRPWVRASQLVQRLPLARFVPYFALAFAFLPTDVDVVLIWAATALLVLRRWSRGEPLAGQHPAYIWVILFGTLAAISAVAGVTPRSSLVALALWLSYLLLLWVSGEMSANSPAVRRTQWGLAAAAALVGAIGLIQWHAGIPAPSWQIDEQANPGITTRVFSVFGDPNMLAAYFTAVLPLVGALVLSERRWSLKGLALLLLGVALASDVLTFSRGGWLALVLAFAILGALWRPRYAPLVVGGLAVALVGAVLLGPDAIVVRLSSLVSGQDTSIVYRFAIWTGVLHMVAAHPWTGVGLGQAAFGAVYPSFMLAGTEAAHAHNIFLELAAEMGIPGMLLFVVLALRLGWAMLLAAVRAVPPALEGTRLAAAAALAGSLAVCVEGLTDNVWFNPHSALGLWLAAGLGVAAWRVLVPGRPLGAAKGGVPPRTKATGDEEAGPACASSTL